MIKTVIRLLFEPETWQRNHCLRSSSVMIQPRRLRLCLHTDQDTVYGGKNMKKVFASDFDGTLYFYRAEVKLPPRSVEKILEYQAAGNYFGLCTGRTSVSAPAVRSEVSPPLSQGISSLIS